MLLKIVSLFLIAMLVLGILGKLRLPRIGARRDTNRLSRPRKCRSCGRFIMGRGACDCGKRG